MLNGVKIEDFLKQNRFNVNPRLFRLIQAMSKIKFFDKIFILNRTERLDIEWGVRGKGITVLIFDNNFEIFDLLKFYNEISRGIKHPDPVFTCNTIEDCCNKLQFFIQVYFS